MIALAYICGSSHLLDIRDKYHGYTALHLAVAADRPSTVRLLVVAGASPNLRSQRGQTPLLVACARGLLRCIMALLRPVDDEERARLMKYCSDISLPISQLPPPPVYFPDANLLDCNGTNSRKHIHVMFPPVKGKYCQYFPFTGENITCMYHIATVLSVCPDHAFFLRRNHFALLAQMTCNRKLRLPAVGNAS